MSDWKAVAKARALDIPEADLDRIISPLEKLEQSFRPLAGEIPVEVEPAVTFRAEEGE